MDSYYILLLKNDNIYFKFDKKTSLQKNFLMLLPT
jgi:hypothetical protein